MALAQAILEIAMTRKFFIGVFITCTILSCNDLKSKQHNNKLTTQSVEDFNIFYKKFYADSTFQINRIVFPLKGYNQNLHDLYEEMKNDENVKKQPESYFTQKGELGFLVAPPLEDTTYRFELKKMDTLVIEKIWIEDSGFLVEKRFKPIDSKWHLVYFRYIDN